MPHHDEPPVVETQNGHKPALDIPSAVAAEQALAKSLYEYAGEWVAVKDHVMIDNSSDLGPLVERINGQRATAEIFRVQGDPGASRIR